MNFGTEDETQEFKESLTQLDKGIRSLTAMLNRNGYGTVYFGVDDDGNTKGVQIGKNTMMDIRNRIRSLVEPQILSEIDAQKDEAGKWYIRVRARGADTPYSCDGRYYVRNVAADESVSNEVLRKMLAAGDTDLIRQIASEEQELTFRQLFSNLAGQIHISDEDAFCRNYGLRNKEGKYNYMAYLLSDQNNLSVKVVKFAGTDKSVMTERTEFGRRCLLDTVRRVLDYVRTIDTTRVELEDGIRREESLFSYEAFREAWINACLHNSWNERVPPSVFLYDDRIEVVSYGGLPYGLSKEGFYKGTSVPVNRGLLTVFIVSGYAEQSGHGVPIIVSEYGQSAFSFVDGLLKVTLPFAFEADGVAGRKAREREQARLTENQVRVYQYLVEHPEANLQTVANEAGISLGGVKKIVAKLQDLEMIRRSGGKRSGRWEKVDFESRL